MLTLLLLAGCGDTMSNAELKAAFDEAASAARVEAFTGEVVEITTTFTIGGAVEDAAEELRAWLQSQLPCSEVSLAGATLTIDFGTLDDACTYAGRTYAGVATVEVRRADAQGVEVRHTWEGLTDGATTLDGGATVTWTADTPTRAVEYGATWTDLDSGEVREGAGDLVQHGLDADGRATTGITVDGVREWSGPAGAWALTVEGIEARWVDPVPQAGLYTLTAASGKAATAAFERVDDDTILVTLASGWRSRQFEVTAAR